MSKLCQVPGCHKRAERYALDLPQKDGTIKTIRCWWCNGCHSDLIRKLKDAGCEVSAKSLKKEIPNAS